MIKVRVLRDQDMPDLPNGVAEQQWAKEAVAECHAKGLYPLEPGDIVKAAYINIAGDAIIVRVTNDGGEHPWYLPLGWYEVVQ
jgi:hypothetical protein